MEESNSQSDPPAPACRRPPCTGAFTNMLSAFLKVFVLVGGCGSPSLSPAPPPHKRLSDVRELEEEGRHGFQLALADEGGRRPSVFIILQPGRCHTSPSSGIDLLPTGDVFTSGDMRRLRRRVMRVSDLMQLLLH